MKPKICELLDVEIDEEFYFRDKDELYRITKIEGSDEYCLQRNCDGGDEDQWFPAETKRLVGMIDHPEEIVKKSRWKSKDIEDAKAIKWLYCEATYVGRLPEGFGTQIWIFDSRDSFLGGLSKAENILPSLIFGEQVRLSEIIGDEIGHLEVFK